ncbi:MAG TPA: hypothetical protein VED66_04900 [Candidatus Sulfotelmatobacter sp.]|nr:hypothetical protein [Candidatus Sulfotelmatobacter sp.]
MPKKVKISLSGIVKQIDQATKNLNAAKGKAVTAKEKKELALKIKHLTAIKKEVKANCPKGAQGLNIIVPEK